MNICFILNISMDTNGPSVHLLKDIINNKGYAQLFIIEKTFDSQFISHENGIKIPFKSAPKSNFISRYLTDLKYLKQVKKYLKSNISKFDVFFIQSSNTAYFLTKFIKNKSSAKVVYNVQDIFPDNLRNINKINFLQYKLFSVISSKLYEKVDKLITISQDMKNTLLEKGISSDKIDVIYNWASTYDVSTITKKEFRELHGLMDKFVVLYAGNIGLFQDVENIINAARLINNENIVFVIIGNGIKKEYVKQLSNEMRLKNILFLPKQDQKDMLTIYDSADINLVTLKKNIIKTALPSKIPFCLKTNKPLIFTVENDSHIKKLLLDDHLTYCIEPSNSEILASKVMDIFNNKINSNKPRLIIYDQFFNKDVNSSRYMKIILEQNNKNWKVLDKL